MDNGKTLVLKAFSVEDFLGIGTNIVRYENLQGEVTYSLELEKASSATGDEMRLDGEWDSGVQFILDNGFPSKSLTGDEDKDYAITQLAIWWYRNERISKSIRQCEDELALKFLRPLVAGAKGCAAADTARSDAYRTYRPIASEKERMVCCPRNAGEDRSRARINSTGVRGAFLWFIRKPGGEGFDVGLGLKSDIFATVQEGELFAIFRDSLKRAGSSIPGSNAEKVAEVVLDELLAGRISERASALFLLLLAYCLWQQKRWTEAGKVLERAGQALESWPEGKFVTFYVRGWCRDMAATCALLSGNHELAVGYWKDAIRDFRQYHESMQETANGVKKSFVVDPSTGKVQESAPTRIPDVEDPNIVRLCDNCKLLSGGREGKIGVTDFGLMLG